MTGAKDSQPAQVVDSLELTAGLAVDGVVLYIGSGEGGLTGVLDGVGNGEASEPVADPVGVTGPDDSLDARLDDRREGREEGAGVWFMN